MEASGGPIYNIQVALNKLASKYYSDDPDYPLMTVTKDGIFGSNTQKAVKSAQHFMGCTVDGIVGPKTKARLYYCAYNKGGWDLSGDPNA